ncbi:unnamed protein product [Polarella glacialis]|uniref:Uncharacterized protein n=1 Tax=Polarella glacialis TaxID=89957 RepID=A0A813IS38_POLGL|nr:unnamed protein product [Polarella glacialis]
MEGENNMGKLSMMVINFMTNQCGWGLQLVDGGNLGRDGSIREQQIKFKATHPLNLIAPHLMIELRQVGYVEINGANTNGIFDKLDGWLKQKWSASQIQADPQYCDVKFSTSSFKSRGSEGENNMGLRSMELVDFMTQQCSWLVFRCDDHVQHGEHHVEFRDQGYIEVNGLHDAQDVKSALDDYYIPQGCTHYTQGFLEKEPYCDLKYRTPGNFYYRSGSTNNLGKRTTELAHFMGNRGWKLMLCNGGQRHRALTGLLTGLRANALRATVS